ncbi:hypothetical protein MJO29_009940 [Puccinia striiformis f. sp. tritici]|uniref:Uncharacterized protein n=1 Tax=Puccinia striiformis f. sp. tritici PST-78 TaxID=1165861 RepID=A0A0L0VT43_9BASI|nr:hypothetical protein Pst134EA_019008 [Puccinia striiformis f. sp. tritici]KAH9449077.1 hypothetical protein Pst134EB_019912 [Puccinia striiformis f. sp. tritici]KAH9458854.1 hypothetical protein Pst134EA_019008 [Puccinia striiformis f. sp. tritici]KAI7948275.1 hypothetical protein MJO29_009940 [Puccinia striiformis f. sp. tritici]KNF02448.1 hypothetical protein PSTG_04354 [Puccinia striiformis f. sp. tritici PST-78]
MPQDRKRKAPPSGSSSKQTVKVVIPLRPDSDRFKTKDDRKVIGLKKSSTTVSITRKITRFKRDKLKDKDGYSCFDSDSDSDDQLDWTIKQKSKDPGTPTPSTSKKIKTSHNNPSSPTPIKSSVPGSSKTKFLKSPRPVGILKSRLPRVSELDREDDDDDDDLLSDSDQLDDLSALKKINKSRK